MPTITYSPTHPIVLIFDFSNKTIEIPTYDPDNTVSANESCLSIKTISDVDGDVTVELLHALPSDFDGLGHEVFDGSVRIPSGKIAVVTPHNEKLLELNIEVARARVHVFVDDEVFPSRISVVATAD
jgi:hypothetical protein